ncbi:hypothetical protein N9S84_00835 [Nitrosomonadales bacterium]|nr:hypothetical protein [Nitrosomonadales bacterium]
MKHKFFLLFLIGSMSCACSLDNIPKIDVLPNIFSEESAEKNIRPENSIEYNCKNKKIFFLTYLNEKKSVWLVLPGREFKLNRIDESENTYTNDITTLEISDEKTQIKNDKEVLYSECIEKKDAV